MKPSFQSKLIYFFLKAVNFKKIIEKRVSLPFVRFKKEFVPKRIKRRFSLNTSKIQNKAIATIERKEIITKRHMLNFHGGAYVFKTTSAHWKFAEQVINKCFCRMTILDYPLAPENNYKDTFRMVEETYKLLIRQYPDDLFIFIGDSAGGGLALAFAQKLMIEKHTKLPEKIILLSPWLDMTMSNPAIKNQENSDYILTVEMLKKAGAKYSDGNQPDNYLLSPINGPLKNLPKTLVFYSSEELFKADCLKLKSMVETINENINFVEFQKMQHDWIIFPIPERQQVIDRICRFING
jgi:monoterpene epsilon-lactone hydrolase